jgi:hypothetical protein
VFAANHSIKGSTLQSSRPQRRVDSLLLPTAKSLNEAETGLGVILADNGTLI